jgi:hypothetical protein
MSDMVFAGGNSLWVSFQAKVAEFVNEHNGQARVGWPISERFPWDVVSSESFTPTIAWEDLGFEAYNTTRPAQGETWEQWEDRIAAELDPWLKVSPGTDPYTDQKLREIREKLASLQDDDSSSVSIDTDGDGMPDASLDTSYPTSLPDDSSASGDAQYPSSLPEDYVIPQRDSGGQSDKMQIRGDNPNANKPVEGGDNPVSGDLYRQGESRDSSDVTQTVRDNPNANKPVEGGDNPISGNLYRQGESHGSSDVAQTGEDNPNANQPVGGGDNPISGNLYRQGESRGSSDVAQTGRDNPNANQPVEKVGGAGGGEVSGAVSGAVGGAGGGEVSGAGGGEVSGAGGGAGGVA